MTTLLVEVATTDGALAALAPEWEALWRRVPDALPFQSPAWLLPWWDAFGTGQPRIALLRADDGRLIGLLPLYVLDEPPERKLLLIGAGTTDYLDLLLDPAASPDAAQRLVQAVLAHAAEDAITACDLTDLPPGSKLRDVVAPPGWREASRWGEPCTVLLLPQGATRLREVVPEGKLRDLRLARNRAERIGGWSIETAERATLDRLIDELIRLHQERWSGTGEPGAFGDPRVGAFHRAAAPGLLDRGMLRLEVLRLGGRAAAAYYVLVAPAGRMLVYLCGFDRAFRRESPGTMLLGEMIEAALREESTPPTRWRGPRGWRELHFLRGGESYKYDWGAEERMTAARRLVPLGR